MIDRDPFPPVPAHDAPPAVIAARAAFAPPYDEDEEGELDLAPMLFVVIVFLPLFKLWMLWLDWRKK